MDFSQFTDKTVYVIGNIRASVNWNYLAAHFGELKLKRLIGVAYLQRTPFTVAVIDRPGHADGWRGDPRFLSQRPVGGDMVETLLMCEDDNPNRFECDILLAETRPAKRYLGGPGRLVVGRIDA